MDVNLAEVTWPVLTGGSANCPGPAKIKSLHTVGGDEVPVVHVGTWERQCGLLSPGERENHLWYCLCSWIEVCLVVNVE